MTGRSLPKAGKITGIIMGVLLLAYYLLFALPFRGQPFNSQRHGQPPLTPAWALECWLWEDDENTARRVDELLKGYARYDIPVRTIMLDSPWSMRYNDFQVDTERYPEPARWFKNLRDSGYRVVLWMTPMVNSQSDDTHVKNSAPWYRSAREKGYLAGNHRVINWWKGTGGFLDYANPEAVTWWHGLQQKVFDYGIDGWKLDGAATLFSGRVGPLPVPYLKTRQGVMTTRSYMDRYYREEYLHGLAQNRQFVTLSRSIDRGFHPEGFAPIDASPVNWVGDQEHHWGSTVRKEGEGTEQKDVALKGIESFESAIESILKSAKLGYNIIGSDVAGFSGDSIPPRLYIRWAQFSTFCGLFLNGGHGERALWKRSRQELEIIRTYAWLHTELVPYIYSAVVEANQGGRVLQRPIKGKYHYMFGDQLLVAPIYKDQLWHTVQLPKGKWRYWFNDRKVLEGPLRLTGEFPLEAYPVYIREGAIIPMQIERSYTGRGDRRSGGYITWLIYPDGDSNCTLHHPGNGDKTTIFVMETDASVSISFQGAHQPHILRIHSATRPETVSLDGRLLSGPEDYYFDPDQQKIIIRTGDYARGEYTIIK